MRIRLPLVSHHVRPPFHQAQRRRDRTWKRPSADESASGIWPICPPAIRPCPTVPQGTQDLQVPDSPIRCAIAPMLSSVERDALVPMGYMRVVPEGPDLGFQDDLRLR